jgi:hypothetical protein
MTDWYKLAESQQLLHEIDVLDQNIHALQHRILTPPCITIQGFDKLQICSLIRPASDEPAYKEVIRKLFMMLKIPYFWIHTVENPRGHLYHLPSTLNIFLITDDIKMHVYKALLHYFKRTDQKSVSVKLLTS